MNVKNFILMLLCSMLLGTHLFSQSPIWVVGNKYLNQQVPTALPYGPNSIDYQGQQANASANAYHNPVSGDLLFFIVDGVIYDNEGYRINKLQLSSSAIDPIIGQSEIVIVPDPGNCKRYYIFADSYHKPILPFYDGVLYYGILDLSIPRTQFNTNRTGDLISFGTNQNVVSLFSLIPSNLMFFPGIESGASQIAVSPKDANGEHLLLYQKDVDVLYGFKITGNGISFISNSIFDASQGIVPSSQYVSNTHTNKRSELEIYPKPSGGYMVVSRSKTLQVGSERIFKVDYAQNGSPITPSYAFCSISQAALNELVSVPKGLEISPNGQYAYVTRTVNSVTQKAIVCIDLNTMNQVALPGITINDAQPFQYSMIESNGTQLFLAKADGLFRINNADSPTIANLSNVLTFAANNQLNLSYVQQNVDAIPVQIPTLPNWEYNYGLYLLPDQMDFDPNCQIGCYALNCAQNQADIACCQLYGSGNLFSPNQDNYVVTSSATWSPGLNNNPFGSVNGEVEFLGDLIIKPGVSLTVVGMTLKFAANSRVIIERDPSAVVPSAKLYLRNSLLTSNAACGSCHLWSGIEVQGHNFLGQNDVNNPADINPMQGYLSVVSSTIENAYFGALTGRIVVPDQIGQGVWQIISGGIIQTKDAVFKNNRHDVYFTPYAHGSRSFFDFTQFITTEDLKLEENQMNELKHAVLKEIRGVEFRSCLFKNYADVDAVGFLRNDGKPRGIGINTFNAHFLAQGSEFSQLDYGVYAESSNSSLPYTVTECNFNKNFSGIFAQGVLSATMTKNVFEVYKVPASGLFVSETIGIRFIGCNRYIVEENIFMDGMPSYQVNAHNYGIEVRSSGLNSNVIENNQFAGLHSGGISRGVNASNYLLPDTQLRGLQWLCNSFQNMRNNDLWVRSGRIAPWQGECTSLNTSPAGNKFSPVSPSGHFHYRLSAASPPIRYYYFNELHAMPTSISPTVQLWQCQAEEYIRVCGRLIKVDESGLAPAGLVELRDSLINQKSTIQAVIDFGATDSLVQQVLLPYLSDEEKRDLLKNNDIVVSDEVIIRYMESNPPANMLYQVLVHNSPLSPKLIHNLMQESSLPSGMKQQVLLIQNGLSDYESKMQFLQYLNLEIQTVENKIMQIYLEDSTELYTTEDFKNLFEQKPHHEFSELQELFTAYLYARDVIKADSINSLLKQLNTDLEFSILSDLALNSITSDYFSVLHNDSALVTQLENMATLLDHQYGPQARAILTGVLGYTFSYPLEDPIEPRNQLSFDTSYDGSVLETVSLFPNPAQDHFFIVFDENADVSQNREVNVYDLSGVLQFTREMKANDYVLEIKTENLAKGMYLVTISANGKDISMQKVAVR